MKIFDMDGPLYKWGTELADVMILSLYWILCSLPIITVGASTTALYYVYGKKIRGEDAYVTKDFFKSFKENFKQSIPITIILLVILISGGLYYQIIVNYQGEPPILLSGIAIFVILEGIAMSVYACAILSRFHMTVKGTFLTAFVLLHRHIVKTILMILSLVAVELMVGYFPPILLVVPALVVAITSFFIQKIFTEHIKAEEDLKASKENSEEKIMEEEDEIETPEAIGEPEEIEKREEKLEVEIEEEEKDFLKYL